MIVDILGNLKPAIQQQTKRRAKRISQKKYNYYKKVRCFMNEQQCSGCNFWSEIKEDLHLGDGSPMDTVRNGTCEKLNKTTLENESCDNYESRSQ